MYSPLVPMLGFSGAVLPITLTPGVSFALVTDRALRTGMAAAGGVVAGTLAGLLTHAFLAAAGLSAVVMHSAEAFTVIKLVGVVYLVAIGMWMLVNAARQSRAQSEPPTAVRLPWHRGGDFAQGYLGNVLNPRAAAVYLTLVPQFLDPQQPLLRQIVALWIAHVLVVGGWLTIWAATVRRVNRRFDFYRYRRRIAAISGVVMVGLGVRTAVTH